MGIIGKDSSIASCDLKALWVPIIVDDFILPNEMIGNDEVNNFKGFINELKDNAVNKESVPMLFKAFDFFLILLEEFGSKYVVSAEISIKERSCFSYFFSDKKIQNGQYKHALYSAEDGEGEPNRERLFNCVIKASEKHLNLDVLTFRITPFEAANKDEQLIVILDCYGFMFITHEHSKKFDKNLRLMNYKIIKELHCLLTDQQLNLLKRTILNSNFDFLLFAETSEESDTSSVAIKEFINKIIVNIREYEPALVESLSDTYIKDYYGENCFSVDYKQKISSVYLQKRTYALGCLKKRVVSSNQTQWLYRASLQDRVETLSMERFLSVSTSQNYAEKIIQDITSVREGLVSKIVFLTENIKIASLSEKAKKISKAREEKIERYVEYVVSETTSFLKLNKLLRNAFYYKIGNTSYFNTVNSEETIDKLSSYNYWVSVLKTLSENTSSLRIIIDLYHKKRLLSETHDLNYRKAREQDNQLVQHALGYSHETSFAVTDSDKKFFSSLGLLIASSTLIATIVPYGLEFGKISSFIVLTLLLLVVLYFGKKIALPGSKVKEKWVNTPFSHINYRSKHSLIKALGDKSLDILPQKLYLEHQDGDDFISNTLNIISDLKFWSHGKKIKLIPDKLMSIGIINVTSAREHPHKRRINISFTYIPSDGEYFTDIFLNSLLSEKDYAFDKNLLDSYSQVVDTILKKIHNINSLMEEDDKLKLKFYSHFIIVYSFDLRDETGGKFYVYKNSIRASYSLRHDSNLIESLSMIEKGKVQYLINEIDILFGRVLYLAFVKPFHSEQTKKT